MPRRELSDTQHAFRRIVRSRPQAAVGGLVVRFEPKRALIQLVSLFVDGRRIAERSFARCEESANAFDLEWGFSLSIPEGATIELAGHARGAPPSRARVAWLGENATKIAGSGHPTSVTDAGIDGVSRPEASPEILRVLAPEFHKLQSRRLQRIALHADEAERRGATFFFDFDRATNPGLMSDARRGVMERVRDQIFSRVEARGRARDGKVYRESDAHRRDALAGALAPIRILFRSLLLIHFRARNTGDHWGVDYAAFYRAVADFVLGNHPREELYGVPDSMYYLCFAEMVAVFGEVDGDETQKAAREFWLPVLEAFVTTAGAFTTIYYDGSTRVFSAYAGRQGAIYLDDPVKRRSVSVSLAESHASQIPSLDPAQGPVDSRWDRVLLQFRSTICAALADEPSP